MRTMTTERGMRTQSLMAVSTPDLPPLLELRGQSEESELNDGLWLRFGYISLCSALPLDRLDFHYTAFVFHSVQECESY
ncbi:hypothetical protein ACFXTO_005531 [Malus domestica]